jgi:hypothetical protein
MCFLIRRNSVPKYDLDKLHASKTEEEAGEVIKMRSFRFCRPYSSQNVTRVANSWGMS